MNQVESIKNLSMIKCRRTTLEEGLRPDPRTCNAPHGCLENSYGRMHVDYGKQSVRVQRGAYHGSPDTAFISFPTIHRVYVANGFLSACEGRPAGKKVSVSPCHCTSLRTILYTKKVSRGGAQTEYG